MLVSPLLTEWWSPKSDTLMLFWEYFHKKLNATCFVSTATPSTLAVVSNTVSGYLDQVRTSLSDPLNSGTASYTMFIHLLGALLRRLVHIDLKSQVQKVMGEFQCAVIVRPN